MVNLYVKKIKNGDINTSTGEPWKVNDVPKLWRAKVEKALEDTNTED